ncbi:MAG: GNAT family N-acetyltransferase [Clostridium sp.]
MIFRKAVLTDLENIREVINDGKLYLKKNGVEQWQGDYPTDELLISDIVSGNNYVLEENGKIIGTEVIIFDGEPSYTKIDGEWLSNKDFVVIHRLSVKRGFRNKNIGSELLKFAENLSIKNNIYSLRIDTHENNSTMKHLMGKNSFVYCGIIYLEDNSKRIAFEKILD